MRSGRSISANWPSDVSDVDLLNGRPYCGNLPPDEFFDYVRVNWTTEGALGPTALPPVVWYTRLMAGGDWRVYAIKVMRDIRAGAPIEWFDGVRKIAARTGATDRIAERISHVEAQLKAEATS